MMHVLSIMKLPYFHCTKNSHVSLISKQSFKLVKYKKLHNKEFVANSKSLLNKDFRKSNVFS